MNKQQNKGRKKRRPPEHVCVRCTDRAEKKTKKKPYMSSKWSKNVNVYDEANQTINAHMKVLRMSMYKWVREGICNVYQCE